MTRHYGPFVLSEVHNVSEAVSVALEEAGFSLEEAIPGLVQTIVNLSDDNEALLDAAANLLADGGL